MPQWNCCCEICMAARQGHEVQPRTQDSLVVSADGERWVILNASPDIHLQIERSRYLWPRGGGADSSRHTPIAAVLLTNGDLDHCLGLLNLREWSPFNLYASYETYHGLVDHNIVFRTLQRQRPHVQYHTLVLGARSAVTDASGQATGLLATAFAAPGKVPLHLEGVQSYAPGVNVGLLIEQQASGARIAYVPGAGAATGLEWAADVDCLFLDGTFWSNDELQERGVSHQTARKMGHCPVGGDDGSCMQLTNLSCKRRVYTHLNNTNPLLIASSPERRTAEASGWTIAEDQMEWNL